VKYRATPSRILVPESGQIITRRDFLQMAGLTLGAVALTACGDDDDDTGSTTTGGDDTETTGTGGTDTGFETTGGIETDGTDGTGSSSDTGGETGDDTTGDDTTTDGATLAKKLYFGIVSDTHVRDEWWTDGAESNALDNCTIRSYTNARFAQARDTLNGASTPLTASFHIGDLLHNPAFQNYDEYFSPEHDGKTLFDLAKNIISGPGGFNHPFHFLLGNHDYDIGYISRETTARLFKDKLGLEKTYYSKEYGGLKIIMLDNYLGETKNPDNPKRSSDGSFGKTSSNGSRPSWNSASPRSS
jgi:hypothetical protein